MGAGASVHSQTDLFMLANEKENFGADDLVWLRDKMCKGQNDSKIFENWFEHHAIDGKVPQQVLLSMFDSMTRETEEMVAKSTFVPENQLDFHKGALAVHNIRDDTGDGQKIAEHAALVFDCGSAETKALKLTYANDTLSVTEVPNKAPSILDFISGVDVRATKDYIKLMKEAEKEGTEAKEKRIQHPMFFLKEQPRPDDSGTLVTTLTPDLFQQYIAEMKSNNVGPLEAEEKLTVVIGSTATNHKEHESEYRRLERLLAKGGNTMKDITGDEEQHFEAASIAFAAAQIKSPVDGYISMGGNHTNYVQHLVKSRLQVDMAWKVLKKRIDDKVFQLILNKCGDAAKFSRLELMSKAGSYVDAKVLLSLADDIINAQQSFLDDQDPLSAAGDKLVPRDGATGTPPTVLAIAACYHGARSAGLASSPSENNFVTLEEVTEAYQRKIMSIRDDLERAEADWAEVWKKEGVNLCNLSWQQLVFKHVLPEKTRILFKRGWNFSGKENNNKSTFITTWSSGWYLNFLHDLGVKFEGSSALHDFYSKLQKVRSAWSCPTILDKDDEAKGHSSFEDRTLVVDCGAGETKTILLSFDKKYGVRYTLKDACPPVDAFFSVSHDDFARHITSSSIYRKKIENGSIEQNELWFLRKPNETTGPRLKPGEPIQPDHFVNFCRLQQRKHKADRVVIGMQRANESPAVFEKLHKALSDNKMNGACIFYKPQPSLPTEEAYFEMASTLYATDLMGPNNNFDATVTCSTTSTRFCSVDGAAIIGDTQSVSSPFGLKPLRTNILRYAQENHTKKSNISESKTTAAEEAKATLEAFNTMEAEMERNHLKLFQKVRDNLVSKAPRVSMGNLGRAGKKLTVIFMGAAAFAASAVQFSKEPIETKSEGGGTKSLLSHASGDLQRFSADFAKAKMESEIEKLKSKLGDPKEYLEMCLPGNRMLTNLCNLSTQVMILKHAITSDMDVVYKRNWELPLFSAIGASCSSNSPNKALSTSFVTTWSTGWYINHLRLQGVSLVKYAPSCLNLLDAMETEAINSLHEDSDGVEKVVTLKSLQWLVKKLQEQAKVYYPPVMKRLEAVANKFDGRLIGLEYKFKSAKSLKRKLLAETEDLLHKNKHLATYFPTILELKQSVKDALRFTMIFPPETYCDGVIATEHALLEGIDGTAAVAEKMKVKNFWQLSSSGSCYQGINCQIQLGPFKEDGVNFDPKGYKFELQFHTPVSFLIKDKLSHVTYEAYRDPTITHGPADSLKWKNQELLKVELAGREFSGSEFDKAIFSLMTDLWKSEPRTQSFTDLVDGVEQLDLGKDQRGEKFVVQDFERGSIKPRYLEKLIRYKPRDRKRSNWVMVSQRRTKYEELIGATIRQIASQAEGSTNTSNTIETNGNEDGSGGKK